MVSPFCSRSRSRSRGHFHWWVRIDDIASARSSLSHCNLKSSFRLMDTKPNRRGSSHVQAVMCSARASPSFLMIIQALEYTLPLSDLYHENWHSSIEPQCSKRNPCTIPCRTTSRKKDKFAQQRASLEKECQDLRTRLSDTKASEERLRYRLLPTRCGLVQVWRQVADVANLGGRWSSIPGTAMIVASPRIVLR